MGYKETDPCIKKAFDDERLFVLMTRDATAPQVVMEWIKLNIGKQPPEKLHEALDCALEMFAKNRHFNAKKIEQKIDDIKWSKKNGDGIRLEETCNCCSPSPPFQGSNFCAKCKRIIPNERHPGLIPVYCKCENPNLAHNPALATSWCLNCGLNPAPSKYHVKR